MIDTIAELAGSLGDVRDARGRRARAGHPRRRAARGAEPRRRRRLRRRQRVAGAARLSGAGRQRRHVRGARGVAARRRHVASDDLVLVTLGTGIGGGVVAGGAAAARSTTGSPASSATWSSTPTVRRASCGRRGCWERYASGTGLARLAREAAVGRRVSRVLDLADGDPEAVRGEHVQLAAREGDRDALAVIDEFGRLGRARSRQPHERSRPGRCSCSAAAWRPAPTCTCGRSRRWFGELSTRPNLRPHPRAGVRPLERARRRRRRRPAHSYQADDRWHVRRAGVEFGAGRGSLISRQAASRPPIPAVDAVLAGLERLVDLEEVLDLLDAAAVSGRSRSWTSCQRGSLGGTQMILASSPASSLHVQHADRPGLDPDARVHRVLEQHERVERIAVAAERVGDEPVVGGIGGGREQPPIEEHAAGLVVDLVLVAAAARDLDHDVDAAVGGWLGHAAIVAHRHEPGTRASVAQRSSVGSLWSSAGSPTCRRTCSRSSTT